MQKILPVLTSEAGLCLTSANWQEIAVSEAVCYLDTLLLKPGVELLERLPDVAAYLGWSGSWVLNAARLVANKEGVFILKSGFDGSKHQFSAAQIITLIKQLKPQAVLIPKSVLHYAPELLDNWPETILPYFSSEELAHHAVKIPHGVYFKCSTESLSDWPDLPRYVFGDVSREQLKVLSVQQRLLIESDSPAQAGYEGLVLTSSGTIDLKNLAMAERFERIDAECACPVCEQNLTKAYLHHLYLQTPLLCQRFLIQHNVYSLVSAAQQNLL